MLIIGIDPGSKGALCLYRPADHTVIATFPFVKYTYSDIRNELGDLEIKRAFIEKPRPPAKDNSVSSARTFGEHIGKAQGLLIGMQIPFELVADKVWQKGLVKPLLQGFERKRALKAVCQERFPAEKVTLDNCDSILIVEYAARNLL